MTAQSQIAVWVYGVSRRSATESAWDWIVAAMTDREFIVVAGFCAIGLLLTAGIGHAFGNFGDVAASLGVMPQRQSAVAMAWKNAPVTRPRRPPERTGTLPTLSDTSANGSS